MLYISAKHVNWHNELTFLTLTQTIQSFTPSTTNNFNWVKMILFCLLLFQKLLNEKSLFCILIKEIKSESGSFSAKQKRHTITLEGLRYFC